MPPHKSNFVPEIAVAEFEYPATDPKPPYGDASIAASNKYPMAPLKDARLLLFVGSYFGYAGILNVMDPLAG